MSNKSAGNKVLVTVASLALIVMLMGINSLLSALFPLANKAFGVNVVGLIIGGITGTIVFLFQNTSLFLPPCRSEDLLKVLNMEWKSFPNLKTELEKLKRRNKRSLDKSSFGPTEAWLSGQLIDLHEKGWIDIRLSPQSGSPVFDCPCQGEYQLTFSGLCQKDKSQGNKLARHDC